MTALETLHQVCRYAHRRGWLAANPVGKLEPGEKPRWTPKPTATLEGDDLARLLEQARSWRPLFELLAFTGEALGFTWADIDHANGLIRVHRQLTRHRVHGPLKTPGSRREVVLAPAIAKQLPERWLASRHKRPSDLVFCNRHGRGLDYRHTGDAFRAAVNAAEITAAGRLSLHSLRHGYASVLIAQGLNVVLVSRQLGHANRRSPSASTPTSTPALTTPPPPAPRSNRATPG